MSINFTIVKKGYNPIEVDNYIKGLEQTITEYKEKTATINKAIINAQAAADNIIKNAHEETEKLLREAREENEKLLKDAENNAFRIKQKNVNQIVMLKNNLTKQKNLVDDFQRDYESLLTKYLRDIEKEDTASITSKIEELEKMIEELSQPDYGVAPMPENSQAGHESVGNAETPRPSGSAPVNNTTASGTGYNSPQGGVSDDYAENLNALKEMVASENPAPIPDDITSYQKLNYEELQELLPSGRTTFN